VSDLRLPTSDPAHTGHLAQANRSARSPITPAATKLPPVELQRHIADYVAAGLPRPEAFHADATGTLHLLFPDGDTTSVDCWAAELAMTRPRMTAWGRYVCWSRPQAWFGWSVYAGCDIAPVAPDVQFFEYGDTIEAHAPSLDPTNPVAGPLLGAAKYRPGQRDYMVFLAHQRPFLLDRRDDVIQALASGQVPAEGRPT
jgi:hypothetical protein